MRIPARISSTWARIKAIPKLELAAKAAGVIGVGAILYDAHSYAKLDAYDKKHTKNADAALKYFNNTQYLTNKSHVTSKFKDLMFRWELSNRLRGAWNATTGYVGSFLGNTFSNIIPLVASVGTLAFKGTKCKIAAGVLALSTLYNSLAQGFSHINTKI